MGMCWGDEERMGMGIGGRERAGVAMGRGVGTWMGTK